MEAFSLLKYWRGAGGVFNRDTTSSSPRTTILTAVTPSSSSDSDNDNDDGPFFDLEFTLPDDSDSEDQIKEQHVNKENMNIQKDCFAEDENEGDDEITVTLSSSSSNSADSGDHNTAALSHPPPSDDLFFKGRFIPIDSAASESETIPKFPVSSILKSATKFRVQMLKFNKSKPNLRQKDKPTKPEPNETLLPNSSPAKSQQKKDQQKMTEEEEEVSQDSKPNSKFFTVKLKVEEVMPLVSLLFTRDHNGSSNSKGSSSHSKGSSKQNGSINNSVPNTDVENTEAEKKFSKDVLMHKYFKKVKPLYVRVSKRYGDKLRFSGQLSFSKSKADAEKQPASGGMHEEGASEVGEVVAATTSNGKIQKQGNLQAGLRVVGKHLGKSRSASASVPPTESSRRRDDSLLQQQDGIQSAILHCKTCFNDSRDMMEGSILSRSVSDSSHENR